MVSASVKVGVGRLSVGARRIPSWLPASSGLPTVGVCEGGAVASADFDRLRITRINRSWRGEFRFSSPPATTSRTFDRGPEIGDDGAMNVRGKIVALATSEVVRWYGLRLNGSVKSQTTCF